VSPPQLLSFLRHQGSACLSDGNLEGLQLFGLGKDGLRLLQAYVDRYIYIHIYIHICVCVCRANLT
jgi:hypothetical protein